MSWPVTSVLLPPSRFSSLCLFLSFLPSLPLFPQSHLILTSASSPLKTDAECTEIASEVKDKAD